MRQQSILHIPLKNWHCFVPHLTFQGLDPNSRRTTIGVGHVNETLANFIFSSFHYIPDVMTAEKLVIFICLTTKFILRKKHFVLLYLFWVYDWAQTELVSWSHYWPRERVQRSQMRKSRERKNKKPFLRKCSSF